MIDALIFACLVVGVMTTVGVGTHFGERWIDSYFEIPPRHRSRDWQALVEPTIKKCRLAGSLNLNVRLEADASDALAQLLKTMAEKLDDAGVPFERNETLTGA